MSCRHVMVDRHRVRVPVSGTAVRSDPLRHLDLLEPCVRAYFVRRVVLVGAESTGKTTLAEMLASQWRTNWVPEFGRDYWERKVAGLSMDGPLPGWSILRTVPAIPQRQRLNERSRSQQAPAPVPVAPCG